MRTRRSGRPHGGADEGAERPPRRRILPLLTGLLIALGLVAVAGVIWLFLAPRSLGGVLTASAVAGTSMEPRVRSGDLVVLEALDTYRRGDVIAYRNRSVDHTFLHRIVGVRGGRFVMRGDRNGWLDPGTASPEDIIGVLRLRIPEGGSVIAWLQVPRHGGSVAALLTAVVLLVGGGATVRRRRRRRRGAGWPSTATPRSTGAAPQSARSSSRRPALAAGLVVCVLMIALAGTAIAFTTPASNGPRAATYLESGHLTYAAAVPPSAVYPDGRVSTGDPVYLRLVHRLELAFSYRFTSPAPHRVAATGSLVASVSDGQGWRRTIPLATSADQGPDGVVLRARLALSGLRRLLARVQSSTGVAQGSYAVAVDARVDVTATVAGRPVRHSFSDHAGMRLDEFQLQTGAAAGDGESLAGRVTSHRVSPVGPARATLLGPAWARIPVADLRRLLPGVDVVLAALLALALRIVLGRAGRDSAGLIQARYGRLIVPLAAMPVLGVSPVEVQDMRSLVQLARRYEAAILHHGTGSADTYLVLDGGLAYRYRTGGVSVPADRPLPAVSLLPAPAAGAGGPAAGRPSQRPARRLLSAARPFGRGRA